MKTYTIQIHYQATAYMDIIAETQEQAEQIAMSKAYSNIPLDLYAEVVHAEVNQ